MPPFHRRLRRLPACPFRGERLAHTRARAFGTHAVSVYAAQLCGGWCLLLSRELLLQQLGGRVQRGDLLLRRTPRCLQLARHRLLLHAHRARQLRRNLIACLELPRVRVGVLPRLPPELIHLVL